LRRDFLGCYGNERIKTPNIDKLAEESVIFDQAYIGSFPTMPARAEVMAGIHTFPREPQRHKESFARKAS